MADQTNNSSPKSHNAMVPFEEPVAVDSVTVRLNKLGMKDPKDMSQQELVELVNQSLIPTIELLKTQLHQIQSSYNEHMEKMASQASTAVEQMQQAINALDGDFIFFGQFHDPNEPDFLEQRLAMLKEAKSRSANKNKKMYETLQKKIQNNIEQFCALRDDLIELFQTDIIWKEILQIDQEQKRKKEKTKQAIRAIEEQEQLLERQKKRLRAESELEALGYTVVKKRKLNDSEY